jgi:type I restriction enzyme S subunit
MKYQAYPEYKDSGVEWLGDVPGHWGVSSIKYLAMAIGTGGTPKQASSFTDDAGVCWLTPGDFNGNEIITDSKQHVTNAACDAGDAKLYAANSIVVIGIGATLGKVGYCLKAFSCNQQINIITPKPDVLGLYLMYSLLVQREQMKQKANAATIGIMNQAQTKTIVVVLPPKVDQFKIANFLDHETAKIDTLIEKQQQLIKLLKEKRQAVISHAVTKGLDADVPMRDSGVEWLGDVPAHWVVRRLKHTAALQSGIPKGKDLTDKISISVPMLRVANVQDGYLKLTDVHHIKIEPDQLERFSLVKGDVLMNEGGDNDKLGRGAIWQGEIEPCIHQNHVFAIRPYDIEPEWLNLVTCASYAKFHFYRVAKQSTNLASISSSNIKETPLLIPPKAERKVIMEHVFNRTAVFDNVEVQSIAQISLLKERRTALISAAVTGKIDVRNWQAPENDR